MTESSNNIFLELGQIADAGSKVILWWSGGVTSAVADYLALKLYGIENCRAIFLDTGNESKDTYRFKKDCEKWYGLKIESISGLGGEFKTIKDVWYKYQSLNVAHGAICSSTLKRDVRLAWEKENSYKYQVFGFDIDETKRAKSMTLNYPDAKAIYPLLLHGLSKKMCFEIIEQAGIEIPIMYKYGFHNNNCWKTGCVKGGIGYWQKMKREWPDKFYTMADVEHELTDLKGEPVTMLKDQSKEAKESGNKLVFLVKHPDYPNLKCIDDMEGREPKPLNDCNGFGCAVDDLIPKNETENEINYQTSLFSA